MNKCEAEEQQQAEWELECISIDMRYKQFFWLFIINAVRIRLRKTRAIVKHHINPKRVAYIVQ